MLCEKSHMIESMNSTAEDLKLCSKCGKNPRADQSGTNPWCKDCRADYQAAYAAGKAERIKDTGFSKGVEAMRHALLDAAMKRNPLGMVLAGDVSRWIANFPAPTPK